MQKKIPVLLLLFFFLLPHALSASPEFSLTPLYSLKNACSTEDLYFSGTFGSDSSKKCSELLWNEKLVSSFGAEAEGSFSKDSDSFVFTLGSLFSLPFNSGNMTDTDWNSVLQKSTYSEFDNNIRLCFDICTGFEYKHDFKHFTLGGTAKAQFSYLSFNAENGRGWYNLDSNNPHYYPDGKYHLADIEYSSSKAALFLGLELEKTFFERLTFSLGAQAAPYTFVFVTDRHTARNYTFNDYIRGVFANYNFYLANSFSVSQRFSILLKLNAQYFKDTKCDEYYNWDESSRDTLSSQKAGYSYYSYEITTGLKIKVF